MSIVFLNKFHSNITFSVDGVRDIRRTTSQREENEKGKEVENLMIHLRSLAAALRLFIRGVTGTGYILLWISENIQVQS